MRKIKRIIMLFVIMVGIVSGCFRFNYPESVNDQPNTFRVGGLYLDNLKIIWVSVFDKEKLVNPVWHIEAVKDIPAKKFLKTVSDFRILHSRPSQNCI